jgi:hypothetical protein
MTTALATIRSYGVDVYLDGNGCLDIQAIQPLPDAQWQEILRLAREHKPEIIEALKAPGTSRPKGKHISPSMLQAWRAARPWILDHLQELEARGWTRKRLFRADVLSYPHGAWGPAWSRNWLREGVEVNVDQGGAIIWTWLESNGQPVTQTSRPTHRQE